jgi:hypothetical protein
MRQLVGAAPHRQSRHPVGAQVQPWNIEHSSVKPALRPPLSLTLREWLLSITHMILTAGGVSCMSYRTLRVFGGSPSACVIADFGAVRRPAPRTPPTGHRTGPRDVPVAACESAADTVRERYRV